MNVCVLCGPNKCDGKQTPTLFAIISLRIYFAPFMNHKRRGSLMKFIISVCVLAKHIQHSHRPMDRNTKNYKRPRESHKIANVIIASAGRVHHQGLMSNGKRPRHGQTFAANKRSSERLFENFEECKCTKMIRG